MLAGKITNAPHVPRASAFLESRDMIRNPVRIFEKYRARLGPTFTFHFGGAKRAIVSTDPAFIQHVLQENQRNYRKSDIQVKRMAEFQGRGLLNSHGDHWLRQRRLLSEGFRRSRLNDLLPMQEQVVDDLMERFDREARQGAVDVHQQMVRFTLRLVGKSLFDSGMEDGELDQIGDAISSIQSFIVRQIVQPYKIPWFRITGQSRRYQQKRAEADKIVRAYIDARKRQGGGDSELLQIMLQAPYNDTGRPMSPDQVLIESLQLLVAGNETSSTALSWTFYLLARHPRYVSGIREEIAATLGDGPIDFPELHRLHLTIRVLDEALRLYPSFWMIDRVALADDEIKGIRVPEGIMVIPYIYGTHRNPAFWKNPESFDPSRFEPGPKKERHPFAHIPFGGGPRICIGSSMAMTQILLVLVAFIRRYDFELATDGTVDIHPMMILRPKNAIKMRFRRVSGN